MMKSTIWMKWAGVLVILACLGAQLRAQQPQTSPVKKGDPAVPYVPVAPPGFVAVEGQPGVFVKNNGDPTPNFHVELRSYEHPVSLQSEWKLTSVKPISREGKVASGDELAVMSAEAKDLLASDLRLTFQAEGAGKGQFKGATTAITYGVQNGFLYVLQEDPACESCGSPMELVIASQAPGKLVLVLPSQDESDPTALELTFTSTK